MQRGLRCAAQGQLAEGRAYHLGGVLLELLDGLSRPFCGRGLLGLRGGLQSERGRSCFKRHPFQPAARRGAHLFPSGHPGRGAVRPAWAIRGAGWLEPAGEGQCGSLWLERGFRAKKSPARRRLRGGKGVSGWWRPCIPQLPGEVGYKTPKRDRKTPVLFGRSAVFSGGTGKLAGPKKRTPRDGNAACAGPGACRGG